MWTARSVPLVSLALALLAGQLAPVAADHHEFDFNVEGWVVDFMRPTIPLRPLAARRVSPFSIKDANRKSAILVNGQYPGPTVTVYENDTVSINVRNNLISEAVSIHWHGIHPFETPYTDGAIGVTQAGIRPGENFTYTFRAYPAGTHYWHSHMDGTQSAKGLRGPFVVKERDAEKRASFPPYDQEKVVVLADEWRDPDVCLKLEGAMAGNDVCSDIDYASIDGQVAWGDLQKPDLEHYPYPLVEVEAGTCYRLRIIMQASNAENYIFSVAGHNMTLIALDGVPVNPLQITSINMRIGERADVILCADQSPGYYPVELNYDYACGLTPGNFIPPGFHPVSSCKFYGFLQYANQTADMPVPTSPEGTGGGAHPKAVAGVPFDLTNPPDWRKTQPVRVEPEPEEPDIRYVIDLGIEGPLYSKPTDEPLKHGRWYMDIDGRRWTWRKPDTPALHTKGLCGSGHVPILNVPENATTVEIVLNNLSPAAHNIHMHGMLFQVINNADFEWCNVNKTGCFVMPLQDNPCPKEDRRASDTNVSGTPYNRALEDLYWGCVYNETKNRRTQNLQTPLRKDSFQLWQRSWSVIRFKANFPGVWQFHCHMEQHIPLGMVTAINVLPSQQPPIPDNVPTEGPCPVWSSASGRAGAVSANGVNGAPRNASAAVQDLVAENSALRQRLKDLEARLAVEEDRNQRQCHA